jgi:16S rRNA (adenine(1408)-N(1))-methyltransferase
LKILEGKKAQPADPVALEALRQRYRHCLVDVGTGDGRFAYHWALEHGEDLAVGVDAVADTMEKLAVKARRKPAKGGAPNLLLAVAAAEVLPGPFVGWADLITVNFPWGSLLSALVDPAPAQLRSLAALGRPGARFVALLNVSIFRNDEYLDRLGLPPLTEERARTELVPAYRAAGIHLERVEALAGEVPHRTSWGQRLILGSFRETLILEGVVDLS